MLAIAGVLSTSVFAQANDGSAQAQASVALRDATAAKQRVLTLDKASLVQTVRTADDHRDAQLQAMYRTNLPAAVKDKAAQPGERILMFASMSMGRGDMHGMMQAALADPRITIEFIGGPRQGGVNALIHWLNDIAQGMKERPAITINPPDFHKYKVTEVPTVVVLRDGNPVARVGGVLSTQWVDSQLRTRKGDLGTYGRMSSIAEVDMTVYLEDRIRRFDWHAYTAHAVANFWRDLAMPTVPHASHSDEYRVDPTVTLAHDIRTPDGVVIARAGQKANPLDTAPLDATLVVVDASDPAERAFARDELRRDAGQHVMVMTTTVPAHAADGWAEWRAWQADIGTHLFAYLPAFASRLKLTGSPSVVSQEGHLLKVRQIALPHKETP
ncbi:TrbC family F-type conjugative pilus assembly protein [Rhodanobacter sp. FW106-PBR-R2A-1-13]|uniref:TrbC family F-type conjugative pilus assembly protein n=1 Tax=Rhodanobacter sp. FW106-PBR-R2A-1-13 TaxID=3454845 RepID=UPI0034E4A989